MFSKKIQEVAAGQQFDGTTGKGLFEWPSDKSGINAVRINLEMGAELKSWEVSIEDIDGNKDVLESGANLATQSVVLIWSIPLATNKGEKIKIVTVGASSAMTATVVWKDELNDEDHG